MVGRKDDYGILIQPETFQQFYEPPNIVIDILDHPIDSCDAVIQTHLAIGIRIFVTDLERIVRRVRRNIDEKGLALMFLDEREGLVKEDIRTVPFRLEFFPFSQQKGVKVAVWPYGGLPDPSSFVPHGFLKSLIHGPHWVIVTEMPLPKNPGAVPGTSKQLGGSDLIARH